MAEHQYLSIGEVLGLLLEDFPDVTISKIRFLESQGLIEPERTPSGYRKFYEGDVELLRAILHEQKANFLPLKVIRDRIESGAIDSDTTGGRTPPRGIRDVEPASSTDSAEGARADERPDATHAVEGRDSVFRRTDGGPEWAGGQALNPGGSSSSGAAPVTAAIPVTPGAPTKQTAPATVVGEARPSSPPRNPQRPEVAKATRPPRQPPAGPVAPAPSDQPRRDQPRRDTTVGAAPVVERSGDSPTGPPVGGAREPVAPGADAATPVRTAPMSSNAPTTTRVGQETVGSAASAPAEPSSTTSATDGSAGARGPAAASTDVPSTPVSPRATKEPGGVAASTATPSPGAAASEGSPGPTQSHPQRTSSPVPGASAPASAAREFPYDRAELCAAAGITDAQLADLQDYGIVTARGSGSDITFAPNAVEIARIAGELMANGIDARHLRAWRQAAERESALFEQRIMPLLRQRNPQARQAALTSLSELSGLGARLHDALVNSLLQHHFDGS